MSAASRPTSAGTIKLTAATMLATVSPVMVGADAASPQPIWLPAEMRTSTLSAARTSSPAMMTGFFIGSRTAIGSIDVIFTWDGALQLFDAGLVDDVLEHRDFFRHPRPGVL